MKMTSVRTHHLTGAKSHPILFSNWKYLENIKVHFVCRPSLSTWLVQTMWLTAGYIWTKIPLQTQTLFLCKQCSQFSTHFQRNLRLQRKPGTTEKQVYLGFCHQIYLHVINTTTIHNVWLYNQRITKYSINFNYVNFVEVL